MVGLELNNHSPSSLGIAMHEVGVCTIIVGITIVVSIELGHHYVAALIH